MSRKVVVVDDSREYLESIRLCSEAFGLKWKMVQALTPDEALTEILKSVPEVLVLDFNLSPDHPRGGLDVAKGLLKQSLSRPITIVVNSANLPLGAQQEFLDIPTKAEVKFVFLTKKALVSDIQKVVG